MRLSAWRMPALAPRRDSGERELCVPTWHCAWQVVEQWLGRDASAPFDAFHPQTVRAEGKSQISF